MAFQRHIEETPICPVCPGPTFMGNADTEIINKITEEIQLIVICKKILM